YNADLANGFGNLVSRTLGMIWRYQEGKIKPLDPSHTAERQLLHDAENVFKEVTEHLDPVKSGDVAFHLALEKIWAYITAIDQYIDTSAPWTLAKEQKHAALSAVLTTITEAIRLIAVLAYPFIPKAVQKTWAAFGFDAVLDISAVRADVFQKVPFIVAEYQLKEQKVMLFPRIQPPSVVSPQPQAPSPQPSTDGRQVSAVGAELIDIADFSKVDLRVAKVLSAEKVLDADKLLVLQIDVGGTQRQIVAGVAEHYSPEEITGKSIVIVANLKPAKIRGIESHGMLLAAKKGKKLCLVTPQSEIESNAKVG
ncbi:MAG: methionine--tRNA ligase subunit beta, partial [Deltaproteobacteria bacterium]|nr:methionine--tRNA ligase subunit beta [Deltaproteobacteria bacterium]